MPASYSLITFVIRSVGLGGLASQTWKKFKCRQQEIANALGVYRDRKRVQDEVLKLQVCGAGAAETKLGARSRVSAAVDGREEATARHI
jgi:hypothetical protein